MNLYFFTKCSTGFFIALCFTTTKKVRCLLKDRLFKRLNRTVAPSDVIQSRNGLPAVVIEIASRHRFVKNLLHITFNTFSNYNTEMKKWTCSVRISVSDQVWYSGLVLWRILLLNGCTVQKYWVKKGVLGDYHLAKTF